MRRKGSFSSFFPSAPVAPVTVSEPKSVLSAPLAASRLSLSLPQSPTTRTRSYEASRASDTHSDPGMADASALDRAVAEVLSPSASSSHIAITRRASARSVDGDSMQGVMVIHTKKPKKKKKLFSLNRSYFVVADAARPVLEVFTSESRNERVYLFSLAGADVNFEADEVSHAVRANCFCLNVQSWRKRGVDYLRPQGFVFYHEDQALMMAWVKCIHVAIRRANTTTKIPATEEYAFGLRCRHSDASTVGADESDAAESERVTTGDTEHDESERESAATPTTASPFVVPSAISVNPLMETTSKPMAIALTTPPRSPRRQRSQNRRRHVVDPISCGDTAATKPPHFPRLNNMLATIKNTSHQPLHTWAEENKVEALQPPCAVGVDHASSTSPTTSSTRPKASFSPPNLMSSLHMPRVKSSSSRHVTGIASPTAAGKRLSDPLQIRKKDDTLFSGFTPFFSPRGPRSGPKHTDKGTSGGSDRKPTAPIPDRGTVQPLATESEPTSSSADERTLERRISNHLARLAFLLVAFAGGILQLSAFLPVAAAGVFVYINDQHADAFATAAIAAVWVYVASSVQASLGVCSILTIMYGWSYADFRGALWQRRRRIADRLRIEESINLAHVQFPGWAVRPDVDRVEWLNKVLVTAWPFMKVAIRNSIMDNLNPVLESSRPAFMSSLSLVRVDLGSRVPVITGVKFVAADTTTSEVTLDIDVRVLGDEALAAELRMVSSLGAAALVSLRDLLLAGTLRVTLAPLATYWPCFSAIRLCFTSRPQVDFSLTAAKINLSNVPFASEWLQTFLHDLLLDYFVWPKVLDVPLWEETSATTSTTS